jgi:hypothetical protein
MTQVKRNDTKPILVGKAKLDRHAQREEQTEQVPRPLLVFSAFVDREMCPSPECKSNKEVSICRIVMSQCTFLISNAVVLPPNVVSSGDEILDSFDFYALP